MAPNDNQQLNKTDIVKNALVQIKEYFLYACLFSAAINVLMMTPIIYMLQVYDRVMSSSSLSTLWMLTLIMVALLLSTGAFEWVRSRVLIAANVRLENSLRDTVSKAAFVHTLHSGYPENANVAMNDLTGLRHFVSNNGIFAFMDAPWTPV